MSQKHPICHHIVLRLNLVKTLNANRGRRGGPGKPGGGGSYKGDDKETCSNPDSAVSKESKSYQYTGKKKSSEQSKVDNKIELVYRIKEDNFEKGKINLLLQNYIIHQFKFLLEKTTNL